MDKISIYNAKIYNSQFKKIIISLIKPVIPINEDYIELFVNLIFFYYGIYKDLNLPGNEFENIKYTKLFKKQKILYFILEVINPFIIKKFELFKIKKIFKLINFFLFLNFLKYGKYIDLNDRVINIHYKILNKNKNRFLNNELLNRNFIWKYFSNFLLLLLPLIQNLNFLKKMKKFFLLNTFMGPMLINLDEEENKECNLCYKINIYNPHILDNCGCLFCYYCLKNNINRTENIECPSCKEKNQKLIPLVN